MDGSRFDNLTRSLALSRRGVLKQLAAGLLAGVSGLGGADLLGAQGCSGIRQRCASDSECCDGFCDPAAGRCACPAGTTECGGACVPLDQFQSDVENCGGCRARCRRAPECQEAACIGGVCGSVPDPDLVGQPCGRDGGFCGPDGACACPADRPTLCPRGCTDTISDVENCGACGVRCRRTANGSAVCAAGVCTVACNDGYSLCGDRCCPHGQDCCGTECCGPNHCCTETGCIWCRCVIGIESFEDGQINPQNACQVCDPRRNPNGWTLRDDGTFCGDGRECCNGDCCSPTTCCDGLQCTASACPDQCEILGQPYERDQRNPDNHCQYCNPDRDRFAWTLVDDQGTCGGVPGRVCCNGDCCSPTECCNPSGFCEECGPHCRIGGEDVDAQRVNPNNVCEICDPEADVDDWSPGRDDAPCGVGQYCCNGDCCPPNQCCNDGACGECLCEIGNSEYEPGDANPLNACEVCNPDQRRDGWSPTGRNTPCGLTDGRFCCEGACCPQGECCNDTGDCETCGCVIGGRPVLENAVNPDNSCQICDPGEDRRGWTVLADGDACGAGDDDRVCCGGGCCPQGQCCVDGSCQGCPCEIGDDTVQPGTVNPDNSCQICRPSESRFTWSPGENGTSCGSEEGQRCCGGECCGADECCVADACGSCLCNIGGVNVPAETSHPDNVCLECNPKNDPFDWTPVQGDVSCGDDQVCCSGGCCDPGLCCLLGVCQFCGCRIGEDSVAEFAVNPENECQWCDPAMDPFAWSPRLGEPCGGGEQFCCGSVCCPDGMCCGLNETCEFCPCDIDGVSYPDGTVNPANPCEVCDFSRNPTAWSIADNNAPCGTGGDLFCCAGACCPDGECCRASEGACGAGPCHCTIGGARVAEGAVNPANECEYCNPEADAAGWTEHEDDAPCGATGIGVCCAGECCADCCTQGVCQFCGCRIGEETYDELAINPTNACQWCVADLDPFGWSPVTDSTACGVSRVCCNGSCCATDECCGLNGSCEPCDGQCRIEDATYSAGEANPANQCEVCDPVRSPTGWSKTHDNGLCAGSDELLCCDGECCPQGFCCIDGRCNNERCEDVCLLDPDSCRCEIDGATYPYLSRNPSNQCEACLWYASSTSWTPLDDHDPCGANDEHYCCRGVCCSGADECCTEEGECSAGGDSVCNGCDIGGRFYPAFRNNPDNDCEFCNPAIGTSWTKTNNNVSCGENRDGKCCNGTCCAPGLCCGGSGSAATCQECGCEIDGRTYLPGQINPANPCVYCNPDQSTSGWTLTDLEFCTADFGRECCNGVCCPYDTCCGFSGQCEVPQFNSVNCIYWQDL